MNQQRNVSLRSAAPSPRPELPLERRPLLHGPSKSPAHPLLRPSGFAARGCSGFQRQSSTRFLLCSKPHNSLDRPGRVGKPWSRPAQDRSGSRPSRPSPAAPTCNQPVPCCWHSPCPEAGGQCVATAQESRHGLPLSSLVQGKHLNPTLTTKPFSKVAQGRREGGWRAGASFTLIPPPPADVQTPDLMGPSNFCSALVQ